MLLSGFGQVVHPGHHGLAMADAFADMQGVGAPMSDHERLAALAGNPLAPHQPPRADPGADASTYYSGCVRNLSPRKRANIPPSRLARAQPRNAARNAAREDRREERDASRKKPFSL